MVVRTGNTTYDVGCDYCHDYKKIKTPRGRAVLAKEMRQAGYEVFNLNGAIIAACQKCESRRPKLKRIKAKALKDAKK